MSNRIKIALKLSGELFLNHENKSPSSILATDIIEQICLLKTTHQFGIVIGGGNFFRGKNASTALGITSSTAHQVGMYATVMNSIMLYDLCTKAGLRTTILSASPTVMIGAPITIISVQEALASNEVIIFAGGTGNPYFTTDTAIVLRALEINAHEIWKATNVDGVYDKDPIAFTNATLLKKISYDTALTHKLAIMDQTAYVLAQEHKKCIRVFNIRSPQSLIRASSDASFGTVINVS